MAILLYFNCERNGANPNCNRGSFENESYPGLTALSYVLLGLFPAVNFLYVINFKELSCWCRKKVLSFKTADTVH